MNRPLDGAVELLDRSLAYTRVALAGITDADLRARTPCADWDLTRLLVHLEDGLDAFTQAAGGVVDLVAVQVGAPLHAGRVDALQHKASALLGAWLAVQSGGAVQSQARPVRLGDASLGAVLLVETAALELTVHGWDVARATGREVPIPADLATALLDIARRVVLPADRGDRFAAAVRAPGRPDPDALLLAHLGRVAAPRRGHPGSFRVWEFHQHRPGF